MRSLVSELPYLPSRGMNPDANGITVDAEECVWIENLRPSLNGLQTREGVRALQSFVNPPDFNHVHFFSNPNVTSPKLFGFDNRTVWELDTSTSYNYWKPADSASSSSNIFAVGGNVTYSKTSDAIQEGFFSEVTDTEWGTYSNSVNGQFPLSGLSYFAEDTLLFYLPGITEITVTFSDASTEVVTGTDWFYTYIPTGLFISYLSTPGNQFPRGICWTLRTLQHSCSFFSTTEVQDNLGGIRLICAGSNPPELGVAESDATERVLYQYDPDTGWEAKTMWQQLSVGREAIGYPASTPVTGVAFDELSGTDELIPGTVIFYTLEEGEICRSAVDSQSVDSSGTPATGYLLFSLGGYLTEGENSSWIKEDGTWKITLSSTGNTKFTGKELYVAYSFKTEVEVKPRHVAFHGGRLILAGTYEDSKYFPWRIRTAQAGDSSIFTSTDFRELLSYGLETVERIVPTGNSIFAFTREGIYRGSYDDNGFLLFNPFWAGGTPCGRTVCSYNNYIYFLGYEDFYIFDGSMVRSLTIREGYSRIKDTAFSLVDSSASQKSFSVYYPQEKEVWFFLKEAGNYPTGAWVFDTSLGIWSRYELGQTICAGSYRESSFLTWQNALGTWEELQQKWNELSNSSSSLSILLGRVGSPGIVDPQLSKTTTSSYSYSGPYATEELADEDAEDGDIVLQSNSVWWIISETVGSDIDWKLITRDFVYGDLARKDRTLLMEFEGLGDPIEIGVNGDFSREISQFIQDYQITLDSFYSKKKYHPDFYDYAIRYGLSGSGFINLRWLQTKAKVYNPTGEA